MTYALEQLLRDRPALLADGATGTNLFAAGLQAGYPPELWNIEAANQSKVFNLNHAFVDAGADIILTNTFGGTAARLKLHRAESRVGESNEIAARLARQASEGFGRQVVVAGSMGPTGELFEPLGSMTKEQGVAMFTEQAIALKAGGVDLLWIETMFSVDELSAAIESAKRTNLPFVCTLSFDMKGRTMMGVGPSGFAKMMRDADLRPVAFGANCGTGPAESVAVILALKAAAAADDILVSKSNCGIPQITDIGVAYTGTPELMANYVHLAIDSGARIVGGCCGTTPHHLKVMRHAMDSHTPGDLPDLTTITSRLGSVSPGAAKQLPERIDRPLGVPPVT